MRVHRSSARRAGDTLRPAVVLGVSNGTGLTIVRDLGRLGVPVVAVDCQEDALGFASRYARAVRCADPHYDEDGFVDDLLALSARLPRRAVVLPAQDDFVAGVSRHAARLEDAFALPVCRWDVMKRLDDKEQQVRAAWDAGVPTPATAFIRAAGDLEAAAAAVGFPAVLKPATPLAFRRSLGIKVLVVDTADDLPSSYARVAGHGSLLLQEAIPGDDDSFLIAATYHDANSRPLAVFTGRKLRQHPRAFGNTRMAESLWSDEVAETTLRLLAHLRYRGVSDVEFKRDPRDGALRLIEINARHGLWAGLATAAGVNLSEVAYRDATGEATVRPRQVDGVAWSDLLRDVSDSVGELRAGRLGLREWAAPFVRVRRDAVIALDDPLPALVAAAHVVRRRVSRLRPETGR
jgi:D-aspartate ligase